MVRMAIWPAFAEWISWFVQGVNEGKNSLVETGLKREIFMFYKLLIYKVLKHIF